MLFQTQFSPVLFNYTGATEASLQGYVEHIPAPGPWYLLFLPSGMLSLWTSHLAPFLNSGHYSPTTSSEAPAMTTGCQTARYHAALCSVLLPCFDSEQLIFNLITCLLPLTSLMECKLPKAKILLEEPFNSASPCPEQCLPYVLNKIDSWDYLRTLIYFGNQASDFYPALLIGS